MSVRPLRGTCCVLAEQSSTRSWALARSSTDFDGHHPSRRSDRAATPGPPFPDPEVDRAARNAGIFRQRRSSRSRPATISRRAAPVVVTPSRSTTAPGGRDRDARDRVDAHGASAARVRRLDGRVLRYRLRDRPGPAVGRAISGDILTNGTQRSSRTMSRSCRRGLDCVSTSNATIYEASTRSTPSCPVGRRSTPSCPSRVTFVSWGCRAGRSILARLAMTRSTFTILRSSSGAGRRTHSGTGAFVWTAIHRPGLDDGHAPPRARVPDLVPLGKGCSLCRQVRVEMTPPTACVE